jgi:transaldolase
VEPLIGPGTVSTLPLETLDAYRDHGNPAPRLEEGAAGARHVFRQLCQLGIDVEEVTRQLEKEGVQKFIDSYDRLIERLKEARASALGEPIDRQAPG